ncbi:MAG: hypothetical protein ACRDFS_11350 [Chloroflexota bacterium]
MSEISISDLQVGDLLLKFMEASASNVMIAGGQAILSHNLSGGHATTTHAALYAGNGNVYEAGSGGIRCAAFRKGLTWSVHRYDNSAVAGMASVIAEGYVAEKMRSEGGYGAYSKSGALGSMFHSSSRGTGARAAESGLWGADPNVPSSSFYCSSFVTRSYIAAGQTFDPVVVPIDADYRYVSPKELQACLNRSRSWTEVGRLVA